MSLLDRFDSLTEADGTLRTGFYRLATAVGLLAGAAGALTVFGPFGVAGAVAWGTVGAAGGGRLLLEIGREIDYYFPRFSRFWKKSSLADIATAHWGKLFFAGAVVSAVALVVTVGLAAHFVTLGLGGLWVPWSITRAVKRSSKLHPAPVRPPREQPVMNALTNAKEGLEELGRQLVARVRGIDLRGVNPRSINLRGINLRRLKLPGRSAQTVTQTQTQAPTAVPAVPSSPLDNPRLYIQLQKERLTEQAAEQNARLAAPVAASPPSVPTVRPTAPKAPAQASQTEISGL